MFLYSAVSSPLDRSKGWCNSGDRRDMNNVEVEYADGDVTTVQRESDDMSCPAYHGLWWFLQVGVGVVVPWAVVLAARVQDDVVGKIRFSRSSLEDCGGDDGSCDSSCRIIQPLRH